MSGRIAPPTADGKWQAMARSKATEKGFRTMRLSNLFDAIKWKRQEDKQNDEENQQICREEKVDTRAPRASYATSEQYTSSVYVPARCHQQLAASR